MPGHQVDALIKNSLPSITDVGSMYNTITVTIRDEIGKDVTNNYAITYVYGTLEVTPRPITVTTGSLSKVYDGQVCSFPTFTIENGLPNQQAFVEMGVGITDVGTAENALVLIFCDNSGKKTTDNYDIT